MNIEHLYARFTASTGVSTDTRTLRGGEIFFALKGENFDGNAYALKALESGADWAVVDAGSEAAKSGDPRIIPVEDSLAALKALAAWHRNHCCSDGKRLPVIGLTGTNGKTTTKELIRAVLAKKYIVTATEGNLTNDIGVPLSVLKIGPTTQIAVIEMGASHPDDIAALVPVSQPDFGLITNVGKAHLEGFGSFEGVCRAKGQLYDWVAAHGEAVFVNADDPVLTAMAAERGLKTLPYGLLYAGAELLPASAEEPFVRIRLASGAVVTTQLIGSYNATNVLAAIAVGERFGVSEADAIAAIAAFAPSNNRSQLRRTERNLLIEDMYNANPSSMGAALDHFATIRAEKRVALLGDMRELGADSRAEHVRVVKRLDAMGLDQVCLVGPEFSAAVAETGSEILCFKDSDALTEWLTAHPLSGCTVLVKGSRGIRMEKAVVAL